MLTDGWSSTEPLLSALLFGVLFHRIVRSVEIDTHAANLLLAVILANGLSTYVFCVLLRQ